MLKYQLTNFENSGFYSLVKSMNHSLLIQLTDHDKWQSFSSHRSMSTDQFSFTPIQHYDSWMILNDDISTSAGMTASVPYTRKYGVSLINVLTVVR